MRLFAGPNGSGKTTLQRSLAGRVNLYHLVSPDDVFESLQRVPVLSFGDYGLKTPPTTSVFRNFVRCSSYDDTTQKSLSSVTIIGEQLNVERVRLSAYNTALICGFLRHIMIQQGVSFSFESVFSHKSKIDELREAYKAGYRVYMYYVATASEELNVGRVLQRVKDGGHAVPEAKIRSRYKASLLNLVPSLKYVYRAYIFDNSYQKTRWLAELTPSGLLHLKTSRVPVWFDEYLVKKISDT